MENVQVHPLEVFESHRVSCELYLPVQLILHLSKRVPPHIHGPCIGPGLGHGSVLFRFETKGLIGE